MRSKPDIPAEVAALGDLPRKDLIERWRKIYGAEPPKGVHQDLLVRAVAWHLQAACLGGLSAETRRLLRSAISRVASERLARQQDIAVDQQIKLPDDEKGIINRDNMATVTSRPRPRRRLTPGARLLREWNGRTHVVDVIEGGYVFEAKVYPSLTSIAGKITGAHWSGPRFFGL